MSAGQLKKLIECLSTVHKDGDMDCVTAGIDFDCLAEQAAQGADIHSILPQVAAHIDCCSDCREEYMALLAIIEAENENRIR